MDNEKEKIDKPKLWDSITGKVKRLTSKNSASVEDTTKEAQQEAGANAGSPFRVSFKEKLSFFRKLKVWIKNFSLWEATVGKIVRLGFKTLALGILGVFAYHNFLVDDAGQISHCYLKVDLNTFEKEKRVEINLFGYRRWNFDRLMGKFPGVKEAAQAAETYGCQLK